MRRARAGGPIRFLGSGLRAGSTTATFPDGRHHEPMTGLEDAGSPTDSFLELEEVPPDARLSPRDRREPVPEGPNRPQRHPVDRAEPCCGQRGFRAGGGVEVELEEA